MFSSDGHYITVYHGTNLFCAKIIQLYGITLNAQRSMTDFGRAFYVTPNIFQAKEWSYVKAQNPQIHTELLKVLGISTDEYLNHLETKIPAYLTFRLDKMKLLQLNGLIFPMPSEPIWHEYAKSWKTFVQNSRIGLTHPFDFVYGPVGARHDDSFFHVRPSKNKKQLSLNTQAAIDCLALLKITILPSKNMLHKKWKDDHDDLRTTNKNLQLKHPFLKEIVHILMEIGKLPHLHAIRLLIHSWVIDEVNDKKSVIWQEPPAYWAHYLLYNNKKLWYEDYETYLLDSRKKF